MTMKFGEWGEGMGSGISPSHTPWDWASVTRSWGVLYRNGDVIAALM